MTVILRITVTLRPISQLADLAALVLAAILSSSSFRLHLFLRSLALRLRLPLPRRVSGF